MGSLPARPGHSRDTPVTETTWTCSRRLTDLPGRGPTPEIPASGKRSRSRRARDAPFPRSCPLAPRGWTTMHAAAGALGERLKVPMNGAEIRRGRCKPCFRAYKRNVGQHRAVSGRFRRPRDAPNRRLRAAIRDAQERQVAHRRRRRSRADMCGIGPTVDLNPPPGFPDTDNDQLPNQLWPVSCRNDTRCQGPSGVDVSRRKI